MQQEGTPFEIYSCPQTQFVASFIGTANLLEGEVETHSGEFGVVQKEYGKVSCVLSKGLSEGDKVLVSTRPEEILVSRDPPEDKSNLFSGKIVNFTFLGDCIDCRVLVNSQRIRTTLRPDQGFREGDKVFVQLPPKKTLAIHWG